MRLVLELLLLESNGLNTESSDMLLKLIEYYTKLQNNHIKHNDKVNPKKVDFIILETTAFMDIKFNTYVKYFVKK